MYKSTHTASHTSNLAGVVWWPRWRLRPPQQCWDMWFHTWYSRQILSIGQDELVWYSVPDSSQASNPAYLSPITRNREYENEVPIAANHHRPIDGREVPFHDSHVIPRAHPRQHATIRSHPATILAVIRSELVFVILCARHISTNWSTLK